MNKIRYLLIWVSSVVLVCLRRRNCFVKSVNDCRRFIDGRFCCIDEQRHVCVCTFQQKPLFWQCSGVVDYVWCLPGIDAANWLLPWKSFFRIHLLDRSLGRFCSARFHRRQNGLGSYSSRGGRNVRFPCRSRPL